MTAHHLPGLHPNALNTYLAGLGLVRALSEQADPDLRAWWSHDVLIVETTVTDLTAWLVDQYRPAPIISPWNGGSGFGAKDKKPKEVLAAIGAAGSERLRDLTAAVALADDITARSAKGGWAKARLVAELRNRCPESLLGWLDASVVLRDDAPVFPPLLGTGGNDGRLDFSTNYHQRLLEVIPELGARREISEAWTGDLLTGAATTRLSRGAIGQFDPAASGGQNSSPFGAADSLVNPWSFILLLEGSFYFAAGLARRLGTDSGRAAMPFCVFSSPDGPTPGAVGETSRGELWTPVWSRPFAAAEISQLFRESRATWDGRTASQASHMYSAIRSYGVSRGVGRFVRYGLHQRNGLAFSAVRLDDVDVAEDAHIRLSVEPESTMAPFGRTTASAVVQAKRRFDREHLAFARTLRAEHLREMLAEQTLADLGVMRSRSARESLVRRRAYPPAEAYTRFLHAELDFPVEFRVAAALASARYPVGEGGWPRPIRDLLIGQMPTRKGEDWREARVRGLGTRSLPEVLAEAVVWRSHHATDSGGVERGFLPFPVSRVWAPWADLHAWVGGQLNDTEVSRSFLACLALDWRSTGSPWTAHQNPDDALPVPRLAVLQAFVSGRVSSTVGHERSHTDAVRYGLQHDWPSRLLAGPRHAQQVMVEATALLWRQGWRLASPQGGPEPADRLVACLVARSDTTPLRRLGAVPPRQPEHPPGTPDDTQLPERSAHIPQEEGTDDE